jgi:uncharacterized protein YkwD
MAYKIKYSERSEEQKEKQRAYARNYYQRAQARKAVTEANAEPQQDKVYSPLAVPQTPQHIAARPILSVETIQQHTTALDLSNGTTIGQAIDGYINALRAAGVRVRNIQLALPED